MLCFMYSTREGAKEVSILTSVMLHMKGGEDLEDDSNFIFSFRKVEKENNNI